MLQTITIYTWCSQITNLITYRLEYAIDIVTYIQNNTFTWTVIVILHPLQLIVQKH